MGIIRENECTGRSGHQHYIHFTVDSHRRDIATRSQGALLHSFERKMVAAFDRSDRSPNDVGIHCAGM